MIEAWHRGIQASVDGDHPSIWKVFKFIQLEEHQARTIEEQLTAGQVVKVGKQDQKTRIARILRIMEEYDSRNIGDYLRGITYNLTMSL